MRPVRRGANPITGDFTNYEKAKPDLVKRIGSGWHNNIQIASYCSYCERPIALYLAVEHIQPKGLKVGLIKPYEHLKGSWTNFLLACWNCNNDKGSDDVVLSEVLLPDRNNTFIAYEYLQDGTIDIKAPIGHLYDCAKSTLKLVGLDKKPSIVLDSNDNEIALDRISQRENVWLIASGYKNKLDSQPNNQLAKDAIISLALATGFFSIWMKVFEKDADMRNRLIDSFAGTRESGCFNPITTVNISPAPNPDNLDCGGKI
jgi:5-methylcytosine-specific restriction endonuclease McrA